MTNYEFDLKNAQFRLETEQYVYQVKLKASFAFVALTGALAISTNLLPEYQGYILGLIMGLFVTILVSLERESKA